MASIDATLIASFLELCREAHAKVVKLHGNQVELENTLKNVKSRIEAEKQVRNRLLDIMRLYDAGLEYCDLQCEIDTYNHEYDEEHRRKILEGE